MTFEGHPDIPLVNSASIICNTKIADTPVTDFNCDIGCTGIETVFN